MFEGEEEKIYARAQNMGGFVLSIRLRNRTSHGKKKGKIKKKKKKELMLMSEQGGCRPQKYFILVVSFPYIQWQ